MVKHTQTILSVFDHFVKLASKGLRKYLTVKKVSEEKKKKNNFECGRVSRSVWDDYLQKSKIAFDFFLFFFA